MIYPIFAEVVVWLHFAFVLYAVFGALLVWFYPRSAWLHVPVFLWAGWIMLSGWVCPLTPLEIRLRMAAGQAGYDGTFIGHYMLGVIYPAGLTRALQVGLGVLVLTWNIGLYALAWQRAQALRKHKRD